ncbi:MAG: branched-chain amino acid ABC transporter permease [Candidatus Rokubacteria bacterium]|nr:branched-chain amino acid ABC transporter permease [Candidatus Rokubacteria bacterium]
MRILGLTALALVLLGLPHVLVGSYFVHVMIVALLFAMLAIGLDLVMGYCGQFSFGQGAFYGIGAYASALLALNLGWPFWVTLPAAVAITAAFGALLGVPSLRLAGHFLAITTIAFQVIVNLVLTQWHSFTGGTAGLTGIPTPAPVRLGGLVVADFESPIGYYYLTLGVAALCVGVAVRLTRTRLGREWLAVREDELLAKTMGINTTRIKVLAFTLSAAMAGAAGSLIAHYLRNIHPSEFTIWTSAEIVAMVILGGRGTLAGPILGAVALTILPEYLRVAHDYKLIFYGVALIVMITFLPRGLVGGLRALQARTA